MIELEKVMCVNSDVISFFICEDEKGNKEMIERPPVFCAISHIEDPYPVDFSIMDMENRYVYISAVYKRFDGI